MRLDGRCRCLQMSPLGCMFHGLRKWPVQRSRCKCLTSLLFMLVYGGMCCTMLWSCIDVLAHALLSMPKWRGPWAHMPIMVPYPSARVLLEVCPPRQASTVVLSRCEKRLPNCSRFRCFSMMLWFVCVVCRVRFAGGRVVVVSFVCVVLDPGSGG